MKINFETNAKKLAFKLSALQHRNIPFALKNSLNDSAFQVRRAFVKQLKLKLKIKKQYIIKQTRIDKASKTDLKAIVYNRSPLSEKLEYGGTVKGYHPIPTTALAKDRKPTRGKYPRSILKKRNVFKRGKTIYKRKGKKGNLTVLYNIVKKATYRAGTINLRKIGRSIVSRNSYRLFKKNLDKAVRSSR